MQKFQLKDLETFGILVSHKKILDGNQALFENTDEIIRFGYTRALENTSTDIRHFLSWLSM